MKKIEEAEDLARMVSTVRNDAEQIRRRNNLIWSQEERGVVEAAVSLFFNILNFDSKKGNWGKRDRFFLAGRQMDPAWYAAMARSGCFPVEELATAGQDSGRLAAKKQTKKVPGFEWAVGYGFGLSAAAGVAHLAQLNQEKWRVYAYLERADLLCGEILEAINWAGRSRLRHLTGLVSGRDTVFESEAGKDFFESFGWHALYVEASDARQIRDACNEAKLARDKPAMIIMK